MNKDKNKSKTEEYHGNGNIKSRTTVEVQKDTILKTKLTRIGVIRMKLMRRWR